jgi:hypothetical protein
MKKIIAGSILIFISASCVCQHSYQSERMRVSDVYMIKSQHLKTAGWILLGSGIGLTAAGVVLFAEGTNAQNNNNYNNNGYSTINSQQAAGAVLLYFGVLSSLGSIPLFIVSRVMYKRAIRYSASLEMEKTLPVQISGIPVQPFPALNIKITL